MTTIDATVSMMEAMPEDARIKVMEYAQTLFTSFKPSNPFTAKSEEDILDDLCRARRQIEDGEGIPAEDALNEIGKKHGFI
ncbi:MAG: hypothetical protein LUE25_03135 [Clostridiales bacterium]|nr:hypothetical protein [Clostridia bacterium]MCD8055695.1 hypothetical protein [Clostridiales bacterium]